MSKREIFPRNRSLTVAVRKTVLASIELSLCTTKIMPQTNRSSVLKMEWDGVWPIVWSGVFYYEFYRTQGAVSVAGHRYSTVLP